MQRFGEKLRILRTQNGMSLQELANKLGFNAHGYISELESGKKKPTAELILNVARLFNVTTDQLLKDELDLDSDNTSQV
jgi:transcriptional regulator with XRE-family HTH domain